MISIKSQKNALVFTAENAEGIKFMYDLFRMGYLPRPTDGWYLYVNNLEPDDPVHVTQALSYGLKKLGAFYDDDDAMSAGERFSDTLTRKAEEVEDIRNVYFKKRDIDSLIEWSR